MERDIDRILIPRDQLERRVAELGAEIAATYQGNGTEITLVTILSGAIIFLADLIRHLPMKMKIGLITVSSYGGATTESRGAQLMRDLNVDVHDRHVLIVDDILDTGGTLRLVQGLLTEREPRSLKTVVLLRKKAKAPADIPADFVGFDIDDHFVVGYGLDYDNHYRNYPAIAVLKPELYES
jgi:hypoxanthine phosphoribosyltransferase